MRREISTAIWVARFILHMRRATGMPWRECLHMARASVESMSDWSPEEAVREEIHYAGGDLE